MTSKEKAIELVKKFMSVEQTKLSDYSTIYQPTAKQCALIAVDDFISYFSNEDFMMAYPEIAIREVEYFNKVKKEIENL